MISCWLPGPGWLKIAGLDKESAQEIYGPVAQVPFRSFVVVKARGAALQEAKLMRDVVHKVDAETAIDQVKTLQQAVTAVRDAEFESTDVRCGGMCALSGRRRRVLDPLIERN